MTIIVSIVYTFPLFIGVSLFHLDSTEVEMDRIEINAVLRLFPTTITTTKSDAGFAQATRFLVRSRG